MRYIEPNEPGSQEAAEAETLRKENQELKRQLQELRGGHGYAGLPSKLWHPSGLTIWSVFLAAIIVLVVAFFVGYVPLQKRNDLIRSEAQQQEQTLPRVEVIQVGRSSHNSELQLPGSVQAITEAPELEEQVRQAAASLQQDQAALDQALANQEQGKSDLEFARATAQRWSHLFTRGVVSQHENEQYNTQYQSRIASVKALEKAVAVQRANVAAAEANL